jgi:hypothetical protein
LSEDEDEAVKRRKLKYETGACGNTVITLHLY